MDSAVLAATMEYSRAPIRASKTTIRAVNCTAKRTAARRSSATSRVFMPAAPARSQVPAPSAYRNGPISCVGSARRCRLRRPRRHRRRSIPGACPGEDLLGAAGKVLQEFAFPFGEDYPSGAVERHCPGDRCQGYRRESEPWRRCRRGASAGSGSGPAVRQCQTACPGSPRLPGPGPPPGPRGCSVPRGSSAGVVIPFRRRRSNTSSPSITGRPRSITMTSKCRLSPWCRARWPSRPPQRRSLPLREGPSTWRQVLHHPPPPARFVLQP